MPEMRITKLGRDENGYWQARVTPDGGETYDLTCRWGSWLVVWGRDGVPYREPAALGLREAPGRLAERVRRLEGRERELVAARRQAAVASGRVQVWPKDASRRASRAPIASLPLAGRVRVRVPDLSR